MNDKYYFDIKNFPTQFAKGIELAKDIKVEGQFNRVILCGMGGSSSFVDLITDVLATDKSVNLRFDAVKGYDLPLNADSNVLYLVSSYSGNTEEVLACLDQIDARGFKYVIISSGGELEKIALQRNSPFLKIPGGIQPRLSTGYFISGIFKILNNCGLIPDYSDMLVKAAGTIDASLDETKAKEMAKAMQGKVPMVYATDNIDSLALLSKIKFNENSKTQSFWNVFPELNHNEMVGFTGMIMSPYFLIFKSQLTHTRNHKRIEIFTKLMQDKGATVEIIELKGSNVLEEILMGYYFVDHVTYYLAAAYGIDPEPVAMVEDFKAQLK